MALILIIDNSEHATTILRGQLEKNNHTVKTARSVKTAMEHMRQRKEPPFNAIFIDASLGSQPEDQGPAIYQRLRRLNRGQEARFFGSYTDPLAGAMPAPNEKIPATMWDRFHGRVDIIEKVIRNNSREATWLVPEETIENLRRLNKRG